MRDNKELISFLKSVNNEDITKRKQTGCKSFYHFVHTYLSPFLYGKSKLTSDFHSFMYKELENIMPDTRKLVIKAYRGASKTTILRLFCLYSMLVKNKGYVIIISSTMDMAKESLEAIKEELENNAALKSDFNITPFSSDTKEEYTFKVGSGLKKIKAIGSGKKIRGLNFLGKRPDLIIIDDCENDLNVLSKTQRAYLLSWFNKAIEKLVSIHDKTYNIIVVGTTLHFDSLLMNLGREPSFKEYAFPLIKKWPSNLGEATSENVEKLKFRGYALDDSTLEINPIMAKYLSDTASFNSEYQNIPITKDDASLGEFTTYEEMPREVDAIYMGIDPSLGKKSGDYFAITLLYMVKSEACFYARSYGYKRSPSAMIDTILKLYVNALSFCPHIKIGVESVAFQAFFKDTLVSEANKRGLYIPIIPIKSRVGKEIRLEKLGALFSDGIIKIYKGDALLQEEALSFPLSKHDDLLDSLEMAYSLYASYAITNYKDINKAKSAMQKALKNLKNKERY